jgi:hypothetical protein
MAISSYPLAWPPHFPRTKRREPSKFHTSINSALGNVQLSLTRFARDSQMLLDQLVISSNVTLGNDRPKDPGVSLWFTWDGLQVCIPIDRYSTVEANLQAIHHIIEARRVELRHGTLALVRATFTGFQLAAPTNRPWWEVLGVRERSPIEEISKAYRKMASLHHPDRGGDHAMMAAINQAWQQAQFIGS